MRNRKFTLVGIYHQPIGSSTGNTHTRFLEEVSQLIKFLITNHTNLVLLDDFNIHAQGIKNPDSLVHTDMMEALGLQQHIDKPMHKLGNTLDLIYMKSQNRVKVLHSFIGNFISDNRVVGIELEIRKKLEKHQSTKHRNYKKFNLNSSMQEFNYHRILEQSSLKDAVQIFSEEMERTLDIIAPLEEKRSLKEKTSHCILLNY